MCKLVTLLTVTVLLVSYASATSSTTTPSVPADASELEAGAINAALSPFYKLTDGFIRAVFPKGISSEAISMLLFVISDDSLPLAITHWCCSLSFLCGCRYGICLVVFYNAAVITRWYAMDSIACPALHLLFLPLISYHLHYSSYTQCLTVLQKRLMICSLVT